MILFYDKGTGKVVGSINGRAHSPEELNMWIGSRDETDRIVCQWIKNPQGEMEPSIQKDIFFALDSKEIRPRSLRVNLETKELEIIQ